MKWISILLAVTLAVSSMAEAQNPQPGQQVLKRSSIGAGLGIPYGVLGSNIDISVSPNVSLSGGIGTTFLAGAGYSFGLKYFLKSANSRFRPRFSAYYGVNAIIAEGIGVASDATSYTGLSLGLGAQWMWGKNKTTGLDFDIIYIATSNYDLDQFRQKGYLVSEPSKIGLSLGFRVAR